MTLLGALRRRLAPRQARAPSFLAALRAELERDVGHSFGEDNWDAERFGPYDPAPNVKYATAVDEALDRIDASGLQHTYELLGDAYSRETLVRVWAYRLLGPHRVRLPLSTEEYWARRNSLRELYRGSDEVDINFLGMMMRRMDFRPIGQPIEMYFGLLGAMNTFVLKQYEYARGGASVRARPGDYVIDGGGCYGDTALFFANQIGHYGRVFCFEFVPANIELCQRNLDLNPDLGSQVEIVPEALWSATGEAVGYQAFGPGTALQPGLADRDLAQTVTIDDFVADRGLARLDLIKTDIEGAEMGALRGAEQTLRRFRPNLALSVYHKDSDFVEMPGYLEGLNLGYRFYLDHFTIYGEETVLFATART